jgi:hypothetical protein
MAGMEDTLYYQRVGLIEEIVLRFPALHTFYAHRECTSELLEKLVNLTRLDICELFIDE